jgi:hypothetical protein
VHRGPIGTDEVCLITDHRILPLSWTRDAYYQAALLLAAGGRGLDVVGAHLRWLWGRCERPRGLWMRSHHTNGAVKDPVSQGDQQLYPLLELCDYHDATGELPRPVGGGEAAGWWAARVAARWDVLPTRGGLLPTAENAADDPASLPYPLSAQILLWATATRLAALAGELGLELDVDPTARSAAASTRELFTVEGPFGRQWAYEVDGCGEHRLYHDADDLPTALAPVLGFCPPCDAAWAMTMRFAFTTTRPTGPGRTGDSARCTPPAPGRSATCRSGSWPASSATRAGRSARSRACSTSRARTACCPRRTTQRRAEPRSARGSPGRAPRSAGCSCATAAAMGWRWAPG